MSPGGVEGVPAGAGRGALGCISVEVRNVGAEEALDRRLGDIMQMLEAWQADVGVVSFASTGLRDVFNK
eukprot:5125023-Alexandrium_andersonii.AAC.1